MNFEFLVLGGYGQFVWPAFIFTFVCCFFLYSKTKKELKKQENMFVNEFEESEFVKARSAGQEKIVEEVLSVNLTF